MSGSLLLFLAGDTAWAAVNQFGWTPSALAVHSLGAVFLVAYTLLGAAALAPAMGEIGEPATARQPRLSPTLLGMLTTASLIAPCLLLIQAFRHRITDGVAIGVGSVALFLLVVTRMAQLLGQVEAQAGQLRQLSRVDELTGLPNRRAWSAELGGAIDRARRDRSLLAVAMIDLDHFKRFNDQFGHPAGDRLLKGLGAAWTDQLRAVDQLARYGGEEFILLLPGASLEEANRVVDRMRAATMAGQTFSVGIAMWDGDEVAGDLVVRADEALYQAKADGRDRTVVAVVKTTAPAAVR
jgi:diguanylate cyclase (GGDEF)-like protein